MRRTPKVLLAAVALLALQACSHRRGDQTSSSAATHTPIIRVEFDAGMPADPDSRSSGTRLAVWDDGAVLIASDPLHPGQDAQVGTISPEQLEAGVRELERAGFFAYPDTVLVAPDSASVEVTATAHGVTRTHVLDTYQQSQMPWWPAVVAALEEFRPAKTQPVDDAVLARLKSSSR